MSKTELRQKYCINDALIRAFFVVWKKSGRVIANTYYPQVSWYLWELRVNSKWSLLWK
jgi:hypothetical protein